jgi:hypothetical protein
MQQPLQFRKHVPPHPLDEAAEVQVVGQLGWQAHTPA